MEVEDILKLKNPSLSLEDSSYSAMSVELEKKILSGVPFAYQLGQAEFYHQKFFVNKNVLIPRPETEYFVDILVQSEKKYERVLDVGTGSGVILLSLLNENVAKLGVGVDLSPLALEVAQINRERLKLQNRSELRISDRLQNVEGQFDLIVSNPPYIKEKNHRALVHQNVDEFEPHMALYLPDGEYEKWFEDFFSQVKSYLKPDGTFMMEGHELELEHQKQMLEKLGFESVKVIQDWSHRPRFLLAINT